MQLQSFLWVLEKETLHCKSTATLEHLQVGSKKKKKKKKKSIVLHFALLWKSVRVCCVAAERLSSNFGEFWAPVEDKGQQSQWWGEQ